MSTTTIEGIRGSIAVHRWEPDVEPRYAVLLAHGYGEHAGRYGHVAAAFTTDGAVVVAPDHLGHGLSDGQRALVEDAADLAADLRTVVEAELPDGLPVVLVGHSMGGIVATLYAQQHAGDLAGLVLSGPVVGGNPGFAMLASMDPVPEVPIDPTALSRDPAVGEAYLADELVYHGAFRKPTLLAMIGAVEAIAAGPSFGDLPVLWLHGELDQLAPYDATSAAMAHLAGPGTSAKVYPGAQHEIFNETNRDEVIDDVLRFVKPLVS